MKSVSVKEFRDRATKVLKSREAVLVTRHGKEAGIYIPFGDVEKLPPEIRWRLFDELTRAISEQMKKKGVTEELVLEEFKGFRKGRSRQ